MNVLNLLGNSKKEPKQVFVHIGKCGGSSVIEEFKKHGLKFQEKHVGGLKFRRQKQYGIIIRNPISRFVSAFNWRYLLVVEKQEQKDLFKGEYELLKKYKDVNNLAEHIYDENGNLVLDFKHEDYYIHHITEDIHFYLEELLKKGSKKHISYVLATETLSEDLKAQFNINLTSHLKKNKKQIKLSELALNNLVKYLEKDFECIETLNAMGLLTDKQYQNLSNKTLFQ